MYQIMFYQQSMTHFLLTDCDQQSDFQYFTHGLLVSETPFYLCTNPFSIGPFQFYFICTYARMY